MELKGAYKVAAVQRFDIEGVVFSGVEPEEIEAFVTKAQLIQEATLYKNRRDAQPSQANGVATVIGMVLSSREAVIEKVPYSGKAEDRGWFDAIWKNIDECSLDYQFLWAFPENLDICGVIDDLPKGPPVWTPTGETYEKVTVFGYDPNPAPGIAVAMTVDERDWVSATHCVWEAHGAAFEPVAAMRGVPQTESLYNWSKFLKVLRAAKPTRRVG